MSKKLLTEFFELCPDGICQDLLTEREKREVSNGALYLSGRIQTCEKKNGNGRVYPCEVLRKEITRYQTVIEDNRALGELDHPDDSVINLKNASHYVTKIWWDGDNVMGKIKVLDTPSGLILKELVKAGVKLGISSRGLGSVNEGKDGVIMVEDDFQLICFDMVSEPSTPGAYMKPDRSPDIGGEIGMYIKESKENKIDNLIDSILKD